jgi:hypothetical protein
MLTHRAGTGTGTALVALAEILARDLSHLALETDIAGAGTDRQWHKNLDSILKRILSKNKRVSRAELSRLLGAGCLDAARCYISNSHLVNHFTSLPLINLF